MNPTETLFDYFLAKWGYSPEDKSRYYHCMKNTVFVKDMQEEKYDCTRVYKSDRIIQIYPEIPVAKDLTVLEGVLKTPVTMK